MDNSDNQKDMMRSREAAEYLGVSVGTLYNWVSTKKIPHYKMPTKKLTLFSKRELEAWQRSCQVTPNN